MMTIVDKIVDSVSLFHDLIQDDACRLSHEEKQLLNGTSYYYILVTDIDDANDPIQKLAVSLNFLAEVSSDHIWNITKSYLDSCHFNNERNRQIMIRLWSCRDFDKKIKSID